MMPSTRAGSSSLSWLLCLILLIIVKSEETCVVTCQDHFEECDYWKSTGMCGNAYESRHCPQSCATQSPCAAGCVDMGIPQYMGGTYGHLIKGIVETSYQYMTENNNYNDPDNNNNNNNCRNQHRECASWAAAGLCLTNPGLMQVKCAPACQSCDKADFCSRCLYFTEEENVWRSGDPSRVMEKLSKDYPQYEPKSLAAGTTTNPSSYVVVLENFVTEKESAQLLEQNEWEYEYVEREVGQDVFERVVHENRTYSFAICGEVCEQNVLSLLERIEKVTGIPKANSEYMELRKYKQGERKVLDHDYQEFERHHPQGVRIATMHMFLSDDNNGGGGGGGALWIPSFNATIEPKFGRAVLWANVLDSNPDSVDPTLQYSIEPPVTEGTQYSATVYFHQRDYKHAEKWACHEPQDDDATAKDRVLQCGSIQP